MEEKTVEFDCSEETTKEDTVMVEPSTVDMIVESTFSVDA
jgi:hypothetical protein